MSCFYIGLLFSSDVKKIDKLSENGPPVYRIAESVKNLVHIKEKKEHISHIYSAFVCLVCFYALLNSISVMREVSKYWEK